MGMLMAVDGCTLAFLAYKTGQQLSVAKCCQSLAIGID